ncbi:MAG TPA: DUF2059 domain-containing protein [Rhizomicrobium sp.]|jgi:hypothetical protein
MLSRFVLGLMAALAFAVLAIGPAMADGTPPPPSSTTASSAADLPSNIPPEKLAAARELLDAANLKSLMRSLIGSLVPAEVAAIKRQNPNVSQDALNTFTTAMSEELNGSLDQFMDIYATVYAEHFSIDELHQVTAFYKSDVGRKMIAAAPQMMLEVMPLAQRMGEQIGARVRDRVNAQLQKHGDSL